MISIEEIMKKKKNARHEQFPLNNSDWQGQCFNYSASTTRNKQYKSINNAANLTTDSFRFYHYSTSLKEIGAGIATALAVPKITLKTNSRIVLRIITMCYSIKCTAKHLKWILSSINIRQIWYWVNRKSIGKRYLLNNVHSYLNYLNYLFLFQHFILIVALIFG